MKLSVLFMSVFLILSVSIYAQENDTLLLLYDGPAPGQHDSISEPSFYPSFSLKVPTRYTKGILELDAWCSKHTMYSQAMADSGIIGHVYCEVIIDSLGKVGSPKIIYGKNSIYKPELIKETLRLASVLPEFTPGIYGSCRVNSKCIFKFVYRKDTQKLSHHQDYVIMIYPRKK